MRKSLSDMIDDIEAFLKEATAGDTEDFRLYLKSLLSDINWLDEPLTEEEKEVFLK